VEQGDLRSLLNHPVPRGYRVRRIRQLLHSKEKRPPEAATNSSGAKPTLSMPRSANSIYECAPRTQIGLLRGEATRPHFLK
jgi:hypothetical protein